MRREHHQSAGIVLYRNGEERQYLLLRSALTRRPVWEFAKGGIEAGEGETEAAERELREETGLRLGDYVLREGFREMERYHFTRGSGEGQLLIFKQVVYFLAEWLQGEVRVSREASRYAWVSAEQAHRLLRFPEKRRVLSRTEAWLRAEPARGVAEPRPVGR
jgi:8-oxo-dGTP pyrophosphatase MutT (NUDIX family)